MTASNLRWRCRGSGGDVLDSGGLQRRPLLVDSEESYQQQQQQQQQEDPSDLVNNDNTDDDPEPESTTTNISERFDDWVTSVLVGIHGFIMGTFRLWARLFQGIYYCITRYLLTYYPLNEEDDFLHVPNANGSTGDTGSATLQNGAAIASDAPSNNEDQNDENENMHRGPSDFELQYDSKAMIRDREEQQNLQQEAYMRYPYGNYGPYPYPQPHHQPHGFMSNGQHPREDPRNRMYPQYPPPPPYHLYNYHQDQPPMYNNGPPASPYMNRNTHVYHNQSKKKRSYSSSSISKRKHTTTPTKKSKKDKKKLPSSNNKKKKKKIQHDFPSDEDGDDDNNSVSSASMSIMSTTSSMGSTKSSDSNDSSKMKKSNKDKSPVTSSSSTTKRSAKYKYNKQSPTTTTRATNSKNKNKSSNKKKYNSLPECVEDLPESYRDQFLQFGFAEWNRRIIPCLIINPFDFDSNSEFRKVWNIMARKHLQKYKSLDDSELKLQVYWYWDKTYSIVDASSFIPYDQGEKEWMEVPQTIQTKLEQNKTLTAREELVIEGIQDAKEAATLEPEERTHYQMEMANGKKKKTTTAAAAAAAATSVAQQKAVPRKRGRPRKSI